MKKAQAELSNNRQFKVLFSSTIWLIYFVHMFMTLALLVPFGFRDEIDRLNLISQLMVPILVLVNALVTLGYAKGGFGQRISTASLYSALFAFVVGRFISSSEILIWSSSRSQATRIETDLLLGVGVLIMSIIFMRVTISKLDI